ncbi:hypothetical protein [Xanthocytophaga agilis]|uniref:Uncharacterized protein n=1 Tax=Xanthocytophaga agilis TaxID=3048010 RepID=A0AAE3R6K6_9BACT|nr:hypothetical protein [Xanthocytophaga agilis]MDJ1501728.1 hypothetical protein [Xanthocytophaga agilis]
MKNHRVITWILSLLLVMDVCLLNAQCPSTMPSAGPKEATTVPFQEKEVITVPFQELEIPFIPSDSCLTGNIMIHVLDQDLKYYSGYEFILEQKDFLTKQWTLFKSYQVCVNYNEGKEDILIIIPDLPNGYYRARAQCSRTGIIGWVPIIMNQTVQDNSELLKQYTLQIPQVQHWLEDVSQDATNQVIANTVIKKK